MNGSCLHSDVVLPAATWYEKHDISSTDLHPFVHAFSPAIGPPWETRTDWDIFVRLAESFSRLAERHLGVRTDLVAAPLLHDTPDELAQIGAPVRDWKLGECEPIPGQTMPKLIPVVRDYPALHAKMTALGPLVETAGTAWKGVSWTPDEEVEELGVRHGRVRGGPGRRPAADGAGRPGLRDDPRPVGHHQRAPGGRELPGAGEAHRQRRSPTSPPSTPRRGSPTRTPRSSRAR